MQNLFTNKKQFNQISQIISQTFDIKENKVKHKIAKKLRFKDVNSLLSNIPKEAVKSESETSLNSFTVMSDDLLFRKTTDNIKIVKINDESSLLNNVKAPLIVNFFMDKLITTDSFHLGQKLYINEIKEQGQLSHNIFENDIKITTFDTFMSDDIFCSTLQHLLTGYVFNKDELLSFNVEQLVELVHYGQIEQYNIIANLHDEIEDTKNHLAISLNVRYVKELNRVSDFYDDFMEYNDHITDKFIQALNLVSYDNDSEKLLINIETPPIGYLQHDEVSQYGFEGAIIEHIHEHIFSCQEGRDSKVSQRTNTLTTRDSNLFDEYDYAIIRHLNFVFKSGVSSLYDGEKYEYIVNDLCFLYQNLIGFIDEETLELFYSFKPTDSHYNRYHTDYNDIHNWDGLCLFEIILMNVFNSTIFNYQENYSFETSEFDAIIKSLFEAKSFLNNDFEFNKYNLRTQYDISKCKDKAELIKNTLKSIESVTYYDALCQFVKLKKEL